MWCGGLPVVMKPANALAVNDIGGILDANLYFFSWAGFIMSLLLLIGWYSGGRGEEAIGIAREQAVTWGSLAAASFIVMVSATRIFRSRNCKDSFSNEEKLCRRTAFGIAAGAFSGVVGFVLIFLGKNVNITTTVTAVVLAIMWV